MADWRKLGVDVLAIVATVTVVFAALDTASDYLYLLTVAGALAGIALILENGVKAPEQATRSFDAPVVDAASA